MESSIRHRRMQLSDIPSAMALVAPQGWNQTESDWRRFIHLGQGGCFVASSEGRVIGTTTTAIFSAVGWIGMVTVDPDFRGRGIGRQLMARALKYLHGRGVRTIKLDATPMGKPLYERLSFQPLFPMERVVRAGELLTHEGVFAAEPSGADLEAVLRLDREAYGIDRSRLLIGLWRDWPEFAAVHRSDGEVDGFMLARKGLHYTHVAPLVTRTPEAAEQLLRWALSTAPEGRLAYDHPTSNTAAVALGQAYGFEPMRGFTRMHLGPEPYDERTDMLFGSTGAEKG